MKSKNFSAALLLFFLIVAACDSYAQNRIVTGKVYNNSGDSLIGVTVKGVGNTSQTITDIYGAFRITVPQKCNELSAFVAGYETATAQITDNNVVFYLVRKSNNSKLKIFRIFDEVYSERVSDPAGVFLIDRLCNPGENSQSAFECQYPGLLVEAQDAGAADSKSVSINTGWSLVGGSAPLVVLGNIILDSHRDFNSALDATFNNNDFLTATVLEESAATIAGAGGANGVIAVKTKVYDENLSRFMFSTSNSMKVAKSSVYSDLMLNADEYSLLLKSYYGNDFVVPQLQDAFSLFDSQSGFVTENNFVYNDILSVCPVRLSLGYVYNQGAYSTDNKKGFAMFKNADDFSTGGDNYQRATFSVALSPSFLDNKLKTDLILSGGQAQLQYPAAGALISTMSYNGDFNSSSSDPTASFPVANPVSFLDNYADNAVNNRFSVDLNLNYKKNFITYNLGYGGNFESYTRSLISDSLSENLLTSNLSLTGNYPGKEKEQSHNISFTSKYDKTKSFLSYSVLCGVQMRIYSLESEKNYLSSVSHYSQYYSDSLNYYQGDYTQEYSESFDYDSKIAGFFATGDMLWKQKLSLSATVREDIAVGSLSCSGFYPSMAAGFDFAGFKPVTQAGFNKLKIKISAGMSGLSSFQNLLRSGLVYQAMQSTDFKDVEFGKKMSVCEGIELGFWKNRIIINAEAYRGTTRSMTTTSENAQSDVYSNSVKADYHGENYSFLIKIAESQIWGVSLHAGLSHYVYTISDDDISLSTGNSFNGIIANYSDASPFSIAVNRTVWSNSEPMEDLVSLYRSAMGQIKPEYSGFLGLDFNIRGFFAGIDMKASAGNYVFNATKMYLSAFTAVNGQSSVNNLYDGAADYNFTTGNGFSDLYVDDASYFKIKNLKVGYNFSVNNTRMSVWISAADFLTITDYSGADPETSTGIDFGYTAHPAVYSLGIKFTF